MNTLYCCLIEATGLRRGQICRRVTAKNVFKYNHDSLRETSCVTKEEVQTTLETNQQGYDNETQIMITNSADMSSSVTPLMSLLRGGGSGQALL